MCAHYHRLVVPVNGTPIDDLVLDVVDHLVGKEPVAITLIYVVEVRQSMALDAELPVDIEQGEAVLHHAEQVARQGFGKQRHLNTELLQARSAGAAVVDEAIERGADAIVMGAVNRRQHGKTTLGENVAYVLKNAPCEVILVRQAQPMDGVGGGS